MTHTLHRRGDRDALRGEFILLAMVDPAVTGQRDWGGPDPSRLRRLLEVFASCEPEAIAFRSGDDQYRYLRGAATGRTAEGAAFLSLEEIVGIGAFQGVCHAVYHGGRRVEEVLRRLRDEDLGVSVTVQGVLDEVERVCEEAGLEPHSLGLSLGACGATGRLPEPRVLELCTMCGHGLVAARLAESLVERVRSGELTPRAAALALAGPCLCNVVDPDRAARLLSEVASGSGDPGEAVPGGPSG